MHLNDKVAVITGAASGIGKEIARTFALAGAAVAIADRNAAAAHAAADELRRSGARTLGRASTPRTIPFRTSEIRPAACRGCRVKISNRTAPSE